MSPSEIQALAVDFDRTLTDLALVPVPAALDALARARRAGRRVVVASGRDLDFLARRLAGAADAIVAENGCLLALPGAPTRRLGPATDVHAALAGLDAELERGRVIASADVADELRLREAIARSGLDVVLVRNRDRVMALPRGVDKASGVLAALAALGVDPARTAAAGDAENDVSLLRAVGYAVAVANAVPEAIAVAHHVTRGVGGEGLAEWITGTWLPAAEASA